MDPRAELQAATERNAQEAREEREAEELRAAAAKAAQEEEESAKARADAAAKAQAEAAAAAAAEGALLVTPLRVAVPEAPEPPPEEAGGDQPGLEREDDVVVPEREAAPAPPTGRPKAAGLTCRLRNRPGASRPLGLIWWSRCRRASARERLHRSRRRPRAPARRPRTWRRPAPARGGRRVEGR